MNYTMDATAMSYLAKIFRLIAKEIRTDEDKEKLAPGEIGISYIENTFYIRNPHTGELMSPNSLEYLKPILDNYDHEKRQLNADTISYVKFYSNVSQLQQIGVRFSPDTIIRQMTSPSILFSPISYDNYAQLGFPTQSGIIMVYKMSEEYVSATWFDSTQSRVYTGYYNMEHHMLEGWICLTAHKAVMVTTEGGYNVKATYGSALSDLDTYLLRVQHEIGEAPTLSVDGTTALPIVDETGAALNHSVSQNTIIVLIYDAIQKDWVCCSNHVSPQTMLNQILAKRIAALTATTQG